MHKIPTILLAMTCWTLASAEDRPLIRDVRPLDPASPDIVGQFHQIGLPKYTDIEKQIIDRAQKLQDKHAALFNKVEIGKSVFEYPGLIAMGTLRYAEDNKQPYSLTLGIRPHHSLFADSFNEYLIGFDSKGIVQHKAKVPYSKF
jgi:hypothetical protein